jgi:hypothetical protein
MVTTQVDRLKTVREKLAKEHKYLQHRKKLFQSDAADG